jgi:hypothetical protein
LNDIPVADEFGIEGEISGLKDRLARTGARPVPEPQKAPEPRQAQHIATAQPTAMADIQRIDLVIEKATQAKRRELLDLEAAFERDRAEIQTFYQRKARELADEREDKLLDHERKFMVAKADIVGVLEKLRGMR